MSDETLSSLNLSSQTLEPFAQFEKMVEGRQNLIEVTLSSVATTFYPTELGSLIVCTLPNSGTVNPILLPSPSYCTGGKFEFILKAYTWTTSTVDESVSIAVSGGGVLMFAAGTIVAKTTITITGVDANTGGSVIVARSDGKFWYLSLTGSGTISSA